MRRGLESGAYPDLPQRHGVFGALLLVLQFYGRYREIGEVLQAPWSPVREQCDERFDRLYAAALAATLSSVLPLKRRPRFHNLTLYLSSTRGVPGDVVECGCFMGLSAYLICQALKEESASFNGTGFRVFDSFEGLSEPTPQDVIPDGYPNAAGLRGMTQKGAFAATLDRVRKNLEEFPGVSFHPGWIPATFRDLPEVRYRFVHVDVDLYQPTCDALAYFYDRLSPGGMIVSDDYTWPGARLALEEYAGLHNLKLEVPGTGQAALRKAD